MKRVLCVWFPNWPIQRVIAARPELEDRPILIHAPGSRRGEIVVACSEVAARRGVTPAMPLAEATALVEESRKSKIEGRRSQTSPASQPSTINRRPSTIPHDPDADRAALRRLAQRCRRFSPIIGLEEAEAAGLSSGWNRRGKQITGGPESLLLDITGCAHLFGGEQGLMDAVRQEFRSGGYQVRLAVAESVGAAWALAHYCSPLAPRADFESPGGWGRRFAAPSGVIREAGGSKTRPQPPRPRFSLLPIEALRLPSHLVEALHELDLRTVGQLQALPRASLPSRFGTVVLQRLDQLFGEVPEEIVPERFPEPVEAEWSGEDPLTDRRAVEIVLERLLGQILEQLSSRGEGILELSCYLGHEAPLGRLSKSSCITKRETCARQFTVRLARPNASQKHIGELVRLYLEREIRGQRSEDRGQRAEGRRQKAESCEWAISRIVLRAVVTAPLEARQKSLFDTGEERERERVVELAALVNRLSGRLGHEAVLRPRLCADAQPERAVRYVPLLEQRPEGRGQRSESRGQKAEGRRRRGKRDHAEGDRPGLFVRPLRLKMRPVPIEVMAVYPDGPPLRFRWKNIDCQVAGWQGPERIETGWWRNELIRRDYYRVDTTSGHRFWLYRDRRDGMWSFQGEYA